MVVRHGHVTAHALSPRSSTVGGLCVVSGAAGPNRSRWVSNRAGRWTEIWSFVAVSSFPRREISGGGTAHAPTVHGMTTGMLFCSDLLRPRQVDEHFAEQAADVRAAGADVVLLDHDALLAGRADEAVRRVPEGTGALWYRGWMVPSDRYAALAGALAARGAHLIVDPGRYRRAHELPGWYGELEAVTPRSAWLPLGAGEDVTADAVAGLLARLGPGAGMVKDFVKSRKHEWHEACFVPDLSDVGASTRVIRQMLRLQGESLAGGVVVRAFEEYTQQSGRTLEVRVWWLDGEVVAVVPHPDGPQVRLDPDVHRVREAVRRLGCRFITTDMALRADGVWRVVEVGDGQVSDLHPGPQAARILTALAAAEAYLP